MAARTSEAEWKGDLLHGKGTMKLGSGAYEGQYSFSSRFESGVGTNPEELIAAAHAACFSMALSLFLANNGMKADSIETKATVSLDANPGGGFSITSSHLDTTVKIPNADKAKFQTAVEGAKAGCPVSKLLNANITMDAKLV